MIGLESGVPQATKDGLSKLGDYALASRLSYFLWNSMPDATLLELAKNKSISQPDVLKAQVERMLSDPRSERFVEHFLDEWLELKKIEITTPDPKPLPGIRPMAARLHASKNLARHFAGCSRKISAFAK